MNIKFLLT